MNSRAEPKRGPRVARGRRHTTVAALCLIASASPAPALADATRPESIATPSTTHDFPKRLAITVVADERLLSTFQQRVSSWFSDGTEVLVTVTSEIEEEQLLASNSAEVRAWIVPLSPESALLTFSCVSPPAAPRHLVREVRLRSGFDELGLERLASVIHSAFVALSQGEEGIEREQAERELGKVGVVAGAFVPSSAPSPPPAPAPPAPAPPAPATPPAAPAQTASPAPDRGASRAVEPRAALLVTAGYGLRLLGPEGVGHGPSLVAGVQLRGSRAPVDLQLSGQYLFSSDFEAAPYFSASVQTSALRVQVGLEPQLKSSFFAQVLLGLGADIAHISARANDSSSMPHPSGTQVRSMGELSLGIMRRGELLDLGIVAQAIFAFEDVHYSATTSEGETPLVTPWPVQPALSIQARFRNPL
ncbi:MAG TPA: hypothetical protein VFK05_28275 [Polyangiaceae bacterium]|nr:hypothetical protein [Polyangiaceae bacterium]